MEKGYGCQVVPEIISLEKLKEITNDFSKERELGSGTFGTVYMGVENEEKIIAVKLLRLIIDRNDEEEFVREIDSLRRLTHPNIVKLLGYCYEIKKEFVMHRGRLVPAERIYRALCFEYMHEGSLQKHLYEEHHGHDWQTRYQIIKGACEGLKYLHEELEVPVLHLDLKPDNILLDKNMRPKLADFGLSKLLSNGGTISTKTSLGTLGYMPPEFINQGLISKKFDIFSLGVVMIRIISGSVGYEKMAGMSSGDFVDHVHGKWKYRLQEELKGTSLNAVSNQVKRCIEIALDCVKCNREERPMIGKIIHMLNETEHMTETMAISPPHGLRNNLVSNSKKACGSTPTSQSMVMPLPVSRAPFPSQQVNSVAPGPGETSNEARTYSVSMLASQVQLITISGAPSPFQRIVRVPKEPGDRRLEIRSLGSSEISKLLEVHPLQLRFPLKQNGHINKCPVTLTNRTDHYVGVWIINPACKDMPLDLCFTVAPDYDESGEGVLIPEGSDSPFSCVLDPHCTLAMFTSVKERQNPALQDRGTLEVVMIVVKTEKRVRQLTSCIGSTIDMEDKEFWKAVKMSEGEVHRAILAAVMFDPASCQHVIDNNREITDEPIAVLELETASCIDWHPTNDWMLMARPGGIVSIFNYRTRERVMMLKVNRKSPINTTCSVTSVKFIAKEKWFAAGDEDGRVHIYNYTKGDVVAEFEAHPGKPVSSLAVHPDPARRYLLTASSSDCWIKLWMWSYQGWKCIRTFNGGNQGILNLIWNPKHDSFANVSNSVREQNCYVQVWNIHSNSNPITTMEKSGSAGYIYTHGNRHFMITCSLKTNDGAYIWDLRDRKHIHKFIGTSAQSIRVVACDPTFRIFLTTSGVSGILCFWDYKTFRLIKVWHFRDTVKNIALLSTKNSRRVCIRCSQGIYVLDITRMSTE